MFSMSFPAVFTRYLLDRDASDELAARRELLAAAPCGGDCGPWAVAPSSSPAACCDDDACRPPSSCAFRSMYASRTRFSRSSLRARRHSSSDSRWASSKTRSHSPRVAAFGARSFIEPSSTFRLKIDASSFASGPHTSTFTTSIEASTGRAASPSWKHSRWCPRSAKYRFFHVPFFSFPFFSRYPAYVSGSPSACLASSFILEPASPSRAELLSHAPTRAPLSPAAPTQGGTEGGTSRELPLAPTRPREGSRLDARRASHQPAPHPRLQGRRRGNYVVPTLLL
mmetsp:Transcript_20105/g.63224  ORF Transcript_20105/g.63224 Transcript_20105/m.63224 type:complete len:283 (-) Transcript_20105:4-852(-)